MTDYLLAVAVVIAIASAATRDRTALILLASFIVSKTMCNMEVPFNPWLWTAIDLAVGGAIIWYAKGARDRIIVAMLAPAIVLYHTQPDWWAFVVNLIVAAQMAMTFPTSLFRKFLRRAVAVSKGFDPWEPFHRLQPQ